MNAELEKWIEAVRIQHYRLPKEGAGYVRVQDLRALFDGKVLVDAYETQDAPKPWKKPAIPEGMVLVPVEPTPKMIVSFNQSCGFQNGYKAMLAASQEQNNG